MNAVRSRRVLILVGASGSGKTVVGRRAAEKSGWSLFDTDAKILESEGAAHIGDIFAEKGEPYFRRLEEECIKSISEMGDRVVVATGGGLPAIAGAMDVLNAIGSTVYLKADVDALWKRVNTDPRHLADRPLLMEGGRDSLERLLEARRHVYGMASVTLDTQQMSVDAVCSLLVAQIGLIDDHKSLDVSSGCPALRVDGGA